MSPRWQPPHPERTLAPPKQHPAPIGPRPRICVWPKCPKHTSHVHQDFPLCEAHIQVVHERIAEIRTIDHLPPVAEVKADAQARADAEAEAKAERRAALGWIYYVRIGDHIKVGYAYRLASRLSAYPPTSKLLATHRGTRDDEARLHRQFAVHLVAGREWYGMAEPILQHIAAVVAEHGTPSVDPFEGRRAGRRVTKAGSLSGSGPQMRRRSKGSGIRVA